MGSTATVSIETTICDFTGLTRNEKGVVPTNELTPIARFEEEFETIGEVNTMAGEKKLMLALMAEDIAIKQLDALNRHLKLLPASEPPRTSASQAKATAEPAENADEVPAKEDTDENDSSQGGVMAG